MASTVLFPNGGPAVSLDQFSVSGLPVGLQLTTSDGTGWKLSVSSATVDHTTVEAVLGNTTLRWLVVNVSAQAWNTATLAVDGTDLTVSGLSGDTDGGYEIWLYAEPAAGVSPSVSFRPNGLATNQECLEFSNSTAGTLSGTNATTLVVGTCGDGTPIVPLHAYITMDSLSGFDRRFQSRSFNKFVGGVLNRTQLIVDGVWTATATVMTSFTIHGSANMKGGTTKVAWRALNRGF